MKAAGLLGSRLAPRPTEVDWLGQGAFETFMQRLGWEWFSALVTRASRPDKRHQLSLINAIQEEEVL